MHVGAAVISNQPLVWPNTNRHACTSEFTPVVLVSTKILKSRERRHVEGATVCML